MVRRENVGAILDRCPGQPKRDRLSDEDALRKAELTE
jgi:hypothetical protein